MNTMERGRVETMTMLPEEMILEILTWVPGRELGRCKCVCRLWKSLIGSPPFLPLYRRRNRCLMLHWSEGGRLHFHYSPLRRHRTGPKEYFRRLGSMPAGRRIDPVTQLVNGVICSGRAVGSVNMELKVISVCTGQALMVPQPLPYDGYYTSSYNLGYDPRSRRYKLLRLIFPDDDDESRMEADVITLGPTGTVWEWRKLDRGGAGICLLPLRIVSDPYCAHKGMSMFSGDGVLCWICEKEGMILFDMNKEIFRWVKLPDNVNDHQRMMVPRVLIDEDRLAIYLWVLPSSHEECECFVLEDEEGNVWRKHTLQLRRFLREEPRWLGFANGSPIRCSEPSIMLMNYHPLFADSGRNVYCINKNGARRLWAEQLPHAMASLDKSKLSNWNAWKGFQGRLSCFDHNKLSNGDAAEGFRGRLSCLLDSNVLYLSLKDVLNGNGLV